MIVTHNQEKTKIVTAPQSSLSSYPTATNIPSTVISVELNENELVEWIWTIYPDGSKVVTGYNIIINSDR